MDQNGGAKYASMFDNVASNGSAGAKSIAVAGGDAKTSNKKLSVERIYQKKSQLEHILLRPDTYVGSVETVTQSMWVWDDMLDQMVQREITYVPGLYKIFDEILVNAADNKIRDAKMNCIKIDIDPETNMVKVWNNGKGIPVVEHKDEKMYVPTLIFGHLLTSSNYNDEEKKITGGRNGYGAKLCNIFSTKFSVETSSKAYKKAFKQTWCNNMAKATEPRITTAREEDFTCVTFHPDLAKFGMEKMDKDLVDLFTRRGYDIAATNKGCKVFINGKKVKVNGFKDYIDLYIKDKVDDNGAPLNVVYEQANDRWEVAITLSEKGFQQVSFVNSIATTKGGRHVDYVTDSLVAKLIDNIKKKEKKSGLQIKPFQVKSHLWVFVNAHIENPTFDSQTKENMTLQAKSFGSKCTVSDRFIVNMVKCGVVEAVQSWMKYKAQEKLNKKCSNQKQSKLKGIPKLDDANDAGTKNSRECTLILTEGDSAKTLAVAGLGVVGRDRYGVFPLKGKLLNVREATHKQIMENAEINNMIKIMGLRYKEKYTTDEAMKTLRYGKIMIMTDQDQDGSHIKGLLINFVHHNWPHLLQQPFLEEFITPIVKVSKAKESISFYSLPEFEEWKKATANWHTYKVKYYKGLGTSTSKEAKEYFSEMERHRIPFKYGGTEDESSILLAFSKKKIEERKEWLTNWMDERKRREQIGLPETFLYGKETKKITYSDFVNRELILFSNMDNVRSIPSLVDGMKPGQRKVLYTCFKRKLVKELKVAQLAGSVAEISAYHHGEASLMGTIIGLAQNYVGSNNLNLLMPIGQFGTRLHGGKDAASPRYIFTQLSTLTRMLFNEHDDALLRYNLDDAQRIEPEWYIPILPLVLVNGAEGIGTGWSTKVPNYDVREIVTNLVRMIDDKEPLPMLPSFKNFKGTIERLDSTRYAVHGEVSIINDTTIEITELPIRVWTQNYKENILEPMLQGSDKVPAFITDYKEYHTDTTVRFVVKLTPEKLAQAEEQGLHKVFKLTSSISLGTMVLFDQSGCIRRYDSADEILREFYGLRLDYYQRRKDFLEGMLAAESLKLDNQARFICEKIEGKITIENKPKKEIVQMLVRRGYDSDPVKTWKESQDKLQALEDGADSQEEEEEDDADSLSSSAAAVAGPDFNYILSMALWCLTKEKKDNLLKDRDDKAEKLYLLKKKSGKDLWKDDLNAFVTKLNEVEDQEKKDDRGEVTVKAKTAKGRGVTKKFALEATRPSNMGHRVAPRMDDIKMKFEKADALKKKKNTKQGSSGGNFDEYDGGDDDDANSMMNKSLSERVGTLTASSTSPDLKPAKKRAPAKPKEPKEPKKPREPKAPREKKASGSPKGKGKKRNPWSGSEEDESISDFSDVDDNMETVVIPRDTAVPKRNAAKKAESKFCDDEEDILEGHMSDMSGEEEFKPTDFEEPAAASVTVDDEDSDFVFNSKNEANGAAGNEKLFDISSDSESEPPTKKPALARPTATATANTNTNSNAASNPTKRYSSKGFDTDSNEDDASSPPPPTVQASKTKTAVKEKPKKEAQPKKPRQTKEKKVAAAKSNGKQPSITALFAKGGSTKPSADPPADQPSKTKLGPKSSRKLMVFDNDTGDGDSDTAGFGFGGKDPLFSDHGSRIFRSPKVAVVRKAAEPKEPKPKKAAAPKRPKKIAISSDSDSDSFAPKSKAAKKRKVSVSDDSDVAPRARAGRAKPAVKYTFDDDEDSDF